jgi:hypothetical protein
VSGCEIAELRAPLIGLDAGCVGTEVGSADGYIIWLVACFVEQ